MVEMVEAETDAERPDTRGIARAISRSRCYCPGIRPAVNTSCAEVHVSIVVSCSKISAALLDI